MDNELLQRVRQMREVGFNASEQESLPFLFEEVFKIKLKRDCSGCVRDGWNSLMGWLRKQEKKENTFTMFKIKKQFEDKDFIFMHRGQRVKVTSANLDEEKAHLMLASKYAHVIEGQPDQPEVKLIESPKSLEVASALTSENPKQGVTVVKHKGKKKLSKSSL